MLLCTNLNVTSSIPLIMMSSRSDNLKNELSLGKKLHFLHSVWKCEGNCRVEQNFLQFQKSIYEILPYTAHFLILEI